MKISVLTVTARDGWQEEAYKSLSKQTLRPDEWIVVSETWPFKVKSPRWLKTTVLQAPPKKRLSNLSASDNHGLRACGGRLVIFYQDFIKLPPDCFEKLVREADDYTFVTTLTKNEDGKPEDMRYLGVDGPRPCNPNEWETNVGLAPMRAIKELGGFDEEYDNGWAWDNCNLAERADVLGYRFILDESNRPQLLPHARIEKDLGLEPNGDRHAKTMEAIHRGTKPVRLSYL